MNYGDNSSGLMSQSLDYLTDYKMTDMENQMEVRTERVFPINSSTYKHIFRLDTAGFLDKSSMLTFKCVAKDGTASAKNLRANCWNGALGAIKRVQLHFGDYEVQNLSEAGKWATLNHLYKVRPDVQTKKLSHYLGNQLHYQVLANEDTTNFAGNEGVTGGIFPDNDRSGMNYGNFSTGVGAAVNSHKITNDKDSNHLHAIPLGMLLSALDRRDIPLFLFTDYKVFLEIEFEADSSQWVNAASANNYAGNEDLAAASGDVLFTDVELCVDYLIFPSKVQEQYRQSTMAEGGLTLDFMNVMNIEKSLQAGTANVEQREDFRLNVLDQEVHYVQMIKKLPDNATGKERVLLGQRSDSVSINTLNYNINGVDIFPTPQHSPLQHYNQIGYILGNDLQVVKPLYCADVNTEYSLLSPPIGNILGKYNIIGLDLTNGEPTIRGGGRQIGNYPIIVKYMRKGHGDINSNINGNPQCATADTGALNINFFVATTRLVNVRTLPSGGMSVVVSNA
jgi:hypothetical protein